MNVLISLSGHSAFSAFAAQLVHMCRPYVPCCLLPEIKNILFLQLFQNRIRQYRERLIRFYFFSPRHSQNCAECTFRCCHSSFAHLLGTFRKGIIAIARILFPIYFFMQYSFAYALWIITGKSSPSFFPEAVRLLNKGTDSTKIPPASHLPSKPPPVAASYSIIKN